MLSFKYCLFGGLVLTFMAINCSYASNFTSKLLTQSDISIKSQFNDSPEHEGVANLIDGDQHSKFLSQSSAGWVMFTANNPIVLTDYEITSANDAPGRDPKKWLLEASNDGVLWHVIDKQEQQVFELRTETKKFPVTVELPHKYYRFSFTQSHQTVHGDSYLQLAEVRLFAATKEPISDFGVNHRIAKLGESITFSDQSKNDPEIWFWTFEHGIPETSTEKNPTVKFSTAGSHNVTLTTLNRHGQSVKTVASMIKSIDPKKPWNGFKYPRVEFAHQDTESKGYQRLMRLMPNIEQTINNISLKVNQKLYKNFSQVPEFEKVVFSLQWSDVLASRGGSGKTMLLTFSTKYIEEQLADKPDEQVLYELEGVFWHELTHGYQQHPSNGSYVQGSAYHAFIEGVADLVRIDAGYHKTRAPKPSKSWLGGYTNTGFFLHWLTKHYDNDFIYKFNQSPNEIKEWSFDKAIQHIIGQPTPVLWREYQNSLIDSINKR